MKRNWLIGLMALALASLCVPAAAATATATLTWTNPTTSVDGIPLTGANALTGIEVYCDTAPIPDSSTLAPLTTLGVVQTAPVTMTVSAAPSVTLYCRLKAARNTERSAFSNQASKVFTFSTIPGMPTQLQITLITTQRDDGSFETVASIEGLWGDEETPRI